jgi:hypothetical protein
VKEVGKDLFKWVMRGGGIKSFEEFQKLLEIDRFFYSNDEKYAKARELSATIFELMKTARYFDTEYNWPYTLKIILVPIASQIEPLSKIKFTLYYMTSIRKKFSGREIRHYYVLLMESDVDNAMFYNPHGYQKFERNGVIILSKP